MISLYWMVATLFALAKCQTLVEPSQEDVISLTATGNGRTWIPTANCEPVCRNVTWERIGNMVKFTIVGGSAGYIAVAISSDTNMGPADDSYVCSRATPTSENLSLSSSYLTGHGPPVVVGPVSAENVVSTAIVNGEMECSFFRALGVTKTVETTPATWNIQTTNFNLLYAEGNLLADGSLTYHTHRFHTSQAFTLLPPQEPEETTAASTTTTMSPDINASTAGEPSNGTVTDHVPVVIPQTAATTIGIIENTTSDASGTVHSVLLMSLLTFFSCFII
uniref:Uncharacterized LOC100184171 n=1 Tax=Ciona intestinalis TaxID=7719 RepID=A0A1W5B9W0_CIOIN|nr:uncharacterized protein LOC100184171 [Ciona intestinalis]|eukprot:XP_002130811.1 uncharacterized protein LOC100184171 [Ciona intestinalis]